MKGELWFFGQRAALELSAELARHTGVRQRVTMTEGCGPNGEKWKIVPSRPARPVHSVRATQLKTGGWKFPDWASITAAPVRVDQDPQEGEP